MKDTKEDLSQTLGVYGVQNGCYFVLPLLGPTTLRDSFGMVIDNNYLDAFARVTWHEKEIRNLSGSKLDYVGVQAATAVDFRGDNMLNFESLEKNSKYKHEIIPHVNIGADGTKDYLKKNTLRILVLQANRIIFTIQSFLGRSFQDMSNGYHSFMKR